MEKTERAKLFDKLMTDPDAKISRELAEDLMEEYPYFLPARILFLQKNKESMGEMERASFLAKAAAAIGDRNVLADLVGEMPDEFQDFYPADENGQAKDTDDTISHFLDTFGNNDEEEIRALEQRIFNPVPDYAQLLAKEEEESAPDMDELDEENMSENDLLINKFIARNKKKTARFAQESAAEKSPELQTEISEAPKPEEPADDTAENSLLSESLAKIYIKQHRYSKALEIIQSLSLNFPEKSIYFADQIRFLKKLVMIENFNKKNNN